MSESSLAKRTLVGAVWMVAWRLATRLLGMLSTFILARILVPSDFGLLAMATTFSAAIDSLSQLGLLDALVRRPEEGRDLHNTAFTLQLVRAVVTAAIVAGSATLTAAWFDEPRLTLILYVLAATTAMSGLENVGIAEFKRGMRYDVQFRLNLYPRLLQLATTIPLALAFQSYWALLAGIVAAKVARLAMTYTLHPYRPGFSLAGWRELAHFSFWAWAASAASVIWDRCDPFVLGPTLGSARIGVFLIGSELATLPSSELVSPASDVLFASFSAAQKEGKNSAELAPAVAVSLMLITLPLAIIISFAAPDVVALLLGSKWQAAVSVVGIVAWTCAFSPFSWIASLTLVVNKHLVRNFWGNVIASLVKLLALSIVIRLTDSLDTIAIVAAVTVILESIAYMSLLAGVPGVSFRPIVRPLLRTAAAALTTIVVLHEVAPSGGDAATTPWSVAMLHLAATGMIALPTFAAVLLALWAASGSPSGPERRLVELAKSLLAPLRGAVRRARRIA